MDHMDALTSRKAICFIAAYEGISGLALGGNACQLCPNAIHWEVGRGRARAAF